MLEPPAVGAARNREGWCRLLCSGTREDGAARTTAGDEGGKRARTAGELAGALKDHDMDAGVTGPMDFSLSCFAERSTYSDEDRAATTIQIVRAR